MTRQLPVFELRAVTAEQARRVDRRIGQTEFSKGAGRARPNSPLKRSSRR